jgi:hypothetical protein
MFFRTYVYQNPAARRYPIPYGQEEEKKSETNIGPPMKRFKAQLPHSVGSLVIFNVVEDDKKRHLFGLSIKEPTTGGITHVFEYQDALPSDVQQVIEDRLLPQLKTKKFAIKNASTDGYLYLPHTFEYDVRAEKWIQEP